MDENTQNQLLVQGGLDAMKELVDGLIQKNMDLRGSLYILKQKLAAAEAKIKELTPKEPDAA